MTGPRTAQRILATHRLDQLITEREFQATVIEIAGHYHWWTHHQHDSRHSAAGWPDLVLVKPPRLLFVELKREDGKVSAHQAHVLELLEASGQTVAVWRPSMLNQIIAELGGNT